MTPPDPSVPEPAIQVAARLLAEGRPAEAARRLGVLVAEAPTYAAAHVLRATALEAAGLVDQAIVSWGRAAALVPRSPLVHRERSRLLATRLAADPPPDLPAAEPDPGRAGLAPPEPESSEPPAASGPPAPAAASGPTDGDPASDLAPPPAVPPPSAPRPGDPAAQTLDVSDLSFSSTPPPAPRAPARPLAAETGRPPTAGPDATDAGPLAADPQPPSDGPPAAGADAAESGAATGPPTDWASAGPDQATILPPEGAAASGPPPQGAPGQAVPADDETGWGVLDEADVPTPPPGAYGEPDVVTPEPAPPAGPTVADELDALITQLEDAPRIRPDPAYAGPEVDVDAGDVDDMASETLAKIYAAQHQYVEAALVYERLAARTPAQADELLERAAELRQRRR